MKLFTQIKETQLQARVEGDKVTSNVLTCVIGDSQQVSKTPTDEQVITVITKHVKNLKQTIHDVGDNIAAVNKAMNEYAILERFLPKRLTDERIMELARGVTDRLVNKGRIMGAVKQECVKTGSLFDGNQVNAVVAKLEVELA